ncbi:putative alkaline phosphatase, partial [Vibrio parahaemolyticus V-223/04]
RCAARYGWFF